MIIKITNIPVGIHALSFEKTVKELQLGEPFVDKLILDCTLDKSSNQIVVNCNLTISVELNCDRCLADYIKTLNSKFTLIYLTKKDEINEGDENVKYLSPTADKIDLTQDVIDYAYLSIPMKRICNDDCKGLCSKCGANLNQTECNCKEEINNPVWDKLLNLKDKLN